MVPQKLQTIVSRKERYEYNGNLSKYQQEGNKNNGKRYVIYEVDEFNNYQNFLYRRALSGLRVYAPEELKSMHKSKKERIEKVHIRAQRELNLWKQSITNKLALDFFRKFFSNSRLGKDLITKYEDTTDVKYVNKLSFKDLGLQKKDVVNKLIELGILPKNFYELKALETCK